MLLLVIVFSHVLTETVPHTSTIYGQCFSLHSHALTHNRSCTRVQICIYMPSTSHATLLLPSQSISQTTLNLALELSIWRTNFTSNRYLFVPSRCPYFASTFHDTRIGHQDSIYISTFYTLDIPLHSLHPRRNPPLLVPTKYLVRTFRVLSPATHLHNVSCHCLYV